MTWPFDLLPLPIFETISPSAVITIQKYLQNWIGYILISVATIYDKFEQSYLQKAILTFSDLDLASRSLKIN